MVRAAILVDGMYLQHVLFELGIPYPPGIEMGKLPDALLKNEEEHHRTYLFDALPYVPPNPTPRQLELARDKKAFLDAQKYKERIIVEYGEVRPKLTTCRACGVQFNVPVQKLVDVKISVRMLSLAYSKVVERIVLVSGDSDLIPAVEALEPSGTTVRLAYLQKGSAMASPLLIQKCPEKHLLSREDFESCIPPSTTTG